MKSLEIEDDARIGEVDETIPLTMTDTCTGSHGPRHFPSLISPSSLAPRSRATRERQCCAMFMVIIGMFISTSVVFNIGRNYRPPWYYQTGRSARGIPIFDLLKNSPRNATTTFSNGTIVVQNDTHSTENHSKPLP
jgi:hypothetical protein